MTATPKLVLATSSRYRQQLLQKLQLPFVAHAPAIDESPLPGETPQQLALRLSLEKAQALAAQYPEALIIGSDQVAVLAARLLAKPGNRQNAVAQLLAASGKSMHFYTGICVLDSSSGCYRSACDHCVVSFKNLLREQIEKYVDLDQPYDCAGGFKVESLGIALFERIRGDDPNALVGLPLLQLINLLAEFNVRIL